MTKKEFFNNVWERNTSKIEVDNLPYTLDGNAKNSYCIDDDYLLLTSDNGVDVVEYMNIYIPSLPKEEQKFLAKNPEYEEVVYSIDDI
jgi:hypothetical protein